MDNRDIEKVYSNAEFVAKCRRENRAGLDQLAAGFKAQGLEFVPGNGNFILVKVGDGVDLFDRLQREGVITRPVKGYGLPEWLRVTVGTRDQNERLLTTLARVRG